MIGSNTGIAFFSLGAIASDGLLDALCKSTYDCLPAGRRQVLLLEPPQVAQQRYESCRQEVARRRG